MDTSRNMGNILYQQQENRHVKQEKWQSYSVSIVVNCGSHFRIQFLLSSMNKNGQRQEHQMDFQLPRLADSVFFFGTKTGFGMSNSTVFI